MRYLFIILTLTTALIIGCGQEYDYDSDLNQYDIKSTQFIPNLEECNNLELFILGEELFFSPILSGNRDTSCATCHHPLLATTDNLSKSIGTKGIGLGPTRIKSSDRSFTLRNAPDIFNRGFNWDVMFWEGRLEHKSDNIFISPAGNNLPHGLNNALSAQALFPITSRTEMLGNPGDLDINGNINEIALCNDGNFKCIWDKVMNRVNSNKQLREKFEKAYGYKDKYTITELANAIGFYEKCNFVIYNTKWDRYISGDKTALMAKEKEGAILFFSKGCINCHNGPNFTDLKFYKIIQDESDLGRFNVTGNPEDKYKFRTPPLRGVVNTFPYFHNGSAATLKEAIKLHDSKLTDKEIESIISFLHTLND